MDLLELVTSRNDRSRNLVPLHLSRGPRTDDKYHIMQRFHEFLLTEAFSLNDFANILRASQEFEAMDGGEKLRNKYLPKTIDYLNQFATGDVPNATFQDIKHYANYTTR